jgi:hypothetical protein
MFKPAYGKNLTVVHIFKTILCYYIVNLILINYLQIVIKRLRDFF